MDTVFIRELAVDTVVGIFDWERAVRQTVILDLEMGADNRRAAASDRIEDALDYKAVSQRVSEYVGAAEFRLVETLAERVSELILGEFDVPWVRVTLNKKGALTRAKDVGVVIERTRDDAGG